MDTASAWTPDAVHNLVWTIGKVILMIIFVLAVFGNPFIRSKDE